MNYLGDDIINQLNYNSQNNQNNQYISSESNNKISKKKFKKHAINFFDSNILENDIISDANITCNKLFANSIEIFTGTSLRSYIENVDLLNTNFDIQIKNLDDKINNFNSFNTDVTIANTKSIKTDLKNMITFNNTDGLNMFASKSEPSTISNNQYFTFYLDTTNNRFCVKCKYGDSEYNGSFQLHS